MLFSDALAFLSLEIVTVFPRIDSPSSSNPVSEHNAFGGVLRFCLRVRNGPIRVGKKTLAQCKRIEMEGSDTQTGQPSRFCF